MTATKEAPVLKACRIEIPEWHPPTLNRLTRGKMRDRIRLGQESRRLIAHYAASEGAAAASGKRRVTITIILAKGQRGPDPDAFFKSVGDSLVKCGRLVDDSRHWVEWAPVKYLRGGRPGTIIELEEIT